MVTNQREYAAGKVHARQELLVSAVVRVGRRGRDV
jgi:hypothetical protein